MVANNSRFLVLPERQRYPNLASRVLGLALRCLSHDWQARWHHPVLVVERFVDETRYRGTCYRACGFEAVGLTESYRRAKYGQFLADEPRADRLARLNLLRNEVIDEAEYNFLR